MNGVLEATSVIARAAAVIAVLTVAPSPAASQTEYYNLDFNRPLRVEDAVPTERRQLDVQLTPLRGETFLGGDRRWRLDPLLSYGIASLTEIEIRAPLLFVQPADPNAPAVIGLTSIGVGAMRALNTESSVLPAMAIAAEVLIPAGSLAPPSASYGVKGLLTKTFQLARLNVNGSYGTYSVVPSPAVSPSCRLLPPGSPGCGGRPTVPDVPCVRVPADVLPLEAVRSSTMLSGAANSSTACLTSASVAAGAPPTVGNRWFAGAALDHAFALSSTLVGIDLFAEHLIGFSNLIDWTAELGIRRQWTPQLVLDVGIARHFAGSLPSTAATIGATYAVAVGRR